MTLCSSWRLARHDFPVPRMSQLPTNPVLAALARVLANRRISAGFIVVAAAGPRHPDNNLLDISAVISTPTFNYRARAIPARVPARIPGPPIRATLS